jgi:hypothetical protein
MSTFSSVSSLIGNLSLATSDAYYTTHGGLFKPNYFELLVDLNLLLKQDEQDLLLPRVYKTNILRPFIKFLMDFDENKFNKLFYSEEDLTIQEVNLKRAIEETAEGLLQRNHELRYYKASFDDLNAFQAIVATIFDDIKASQIDQLAQTILPPLAKWGYRKSPYALPESMQALKKMGIQGGFVTLPAANRTGGLLAWASLSHEVAGHHVLRNITGLIEELQRVVKENILDVLAQQQSSFLKEKLADYWSACVEETASDIIGVLTGGPSFSIAWIGYMRAIRKGRLESSGVLYSTKKNHAKNSLILKSSSGKHIFIDKVRYEVVLEEKKGVLGYLGPSNTDPLKYEKFYSSDKHPLDILRPFVHLVIIQLIGDLVWEKLIEDEVHRDLEKCSIELLELEGKSKVVATPIPQELAIQSAQIAAKSIVNSPLDSLQGKRLLDVFNWTEQDTQFVEIIKESISHSNCDHLPSKLPKNRSYARHIMAASVFVAIESKSESDSVIHKIELTFNRMKKLLLNCFETTSWKYSSHTTITSLDYLGLPIKSDEFIEEKTFSTSQSSQNSQPSGSSTASSISTPSESNTQTDGKKPQTYSAISVEEINRDPWKVRGFSKMAHENWFEEQIHSLCKEKACFVDTFNDNTFNHLDLIELINERKSDAPKVLIINCHLHYSLVIYDQIKEIVYRFNSLSQELNELESKVIEKMQQKFKIKSVISNNTIPQDGIEDGWSCAFHDIHFLRQFLSGSSIQEIDQNPLTPNSLAQEFTKYYHFLEEKLIEIPETHHHFFNVNLKDKSIHELTILLKSICSQIYQDANKGSSDRWKQLECILIKFWWMYQEDPLTFDQCVEHMKDFTKNERKFLVKTLDNVKDQREPIIELLQTAYHLKYGHALSQDI